MTQVYQSLPMGFLGPLYVQVHKVLRSRIMAGEWKPQHLLPGEIELSHELGVSVGTIRRAMDQLARENLVVRARGRGTYVKRGDQWQSPTGFRLVDARGQSIAPKLVEIETCIADAAPEEMVLIPAKANSSPTPRICRTVRLWSVGDLPLYRETISVSASRFPNLQRHIDSEAETFHAIYSDVFRVRIESVGWEIGRADDAAPIAVGPLVLKPSNMLTRLAYDGGAGAVELCRYEIRIENFTVQIGR